MKLSKELLQAIVVGVALSGGACSLLQDEVEIKTDTCTEEGIEQEGPNKGDSFYNCPACGMG